MKKLLLRGNERIISTHSTRDGAVVSCNQLRQAENAEEPK